MAQVGSSDEFCEHNELSSSTKNRKLGNHPSECWLLKKDCTMKKEKPQIELTGHFSYSDIHIQQIILDHKGQKA
jgi:hypothetical protein